MDWARMPTAPSPEVLIEVFGSVATLTAPALEAWVTVPLTHTAV